MYSKCCHLVYLLLVMHSQSFYDPWFVIGALKVSELYCICIVAFSALELSAGDPIAQVREDISKAGLTINVHKSCFSQVFG